MKQNTTLAIILLWAACVAAQPPVMVKDINPGPGSSALQFDNIMTSYNGQLFFMADDGTHGAELWASDGTEDGTYLFKDIYPGITGSDSRNFYEVNGYLVFTARNNFNGTELWRTDGTVEGTMLVKDLNPGFSSGVWISPQPQNDFYVWNDVLYFTGNNGTNGYELWRSDGTEAGTFMVKDINNTNPGPGSHSFPSHFAEHDGKLYFAANDGTNGKELWATDGTEAGTVLVKDINPGPFSSNPANLVSCNGYLLFTREISFSNLELWRSNGPAG